MEAVPAVRQRYRSALIFVLTAIGALPCAAVPGALTTLIDNGQPSNRVDIVFVGDGYTQANLNAGLYTQHVTSYAQHMFRAGNVLNDPFSRYAKFFNLHAIDVASAQSGADRPYDGVFVNTALDATFQNTSTTRLLTINNSKARTLRDQSLAGTGITADMQLAVVNESKYGGAGGSWAVFAGRNSSAHEIALHELGHSFSNLADEYFYTSNAYTGTERSQPNVTKDPAGAKWARWLGFDDPRGSNLDIGVFEGADDYATGLYRPSDNSKMRALDRSFDAVSREAIILDIYDFVDPLDDWLENGNVIVDLPLWVDLVDPAVQAVEWYVDGVLLPDVITPTFDAALHGLSPGSYSVRARAFDTVLDHVHDGGWLDLVRKDLDRLEQSVTWNLTLSAPLPGDFDDNRVVDQNDLLIWAGNFGTANSTAAGDADGADFLVWQRNLSPATSAARIPEPAAEFFLAVAVAAVSHCGVLERRVGRPATGA